MDYEKLTKTKFTRLDPRRGPSGKAAAGEETAGAVNGARKGKWNETERRRSDKYLMYKGEEFHRLYLKQKMLIVI